MCPSLVLLLKDTIAEQNVAYDTACSSCPPVSKCVDCTVADNDTAVWCSWVLDYTSSPEENGTLASLTLDSGFWRTSNNSQTILECYNPDACVGGKAEECGGVNCRDGYCASGYTGPCEYLREPRTGIDGRR